MNNLRGLTQEEFQNYQQWAAVHQDELLLSDMAQYHDGDYIDIAIFEIAEKAIGLVDTNSNNVGWEAQGSNRVELIYEAIANHSNEYVRAEIAGSVFAKNIEVASIKSQFAIPFRLLKKLSRDESVLVRMAVAHSGYATREILDDLASDPEETVRSAVAGNALTPAMTLDKLAADESLTVLRMLAANPSAQSKTLSKISTIESYVIKRNLASNPATPPEILWSLIKDKGDYWNEMQVWASAATNPNAPRDLLAALAKHNAAGTWVNLAKNPNTPQEVIIMMAEQTAGTIGSDSEWPKALLDNPLLPLPYFERFADTTNGIIRRWVRDNPRTPDSLRKRLSYDPDQTEIDRYHIGSKKPRFPETSEPRSLIEIYSLSQSAGDRATAASALNAPYEILERLSLDWSPDVRGCVARNKYASEDLMLRLCNDDSKKVRRTLAENPNITPDIIERLLLDDDEGVHTALAKRTDIPVSALERLAVSGSIAVRKAVAGNENLPYGAITTLMNDESALVRNCVATRSGLTRADYEHMINQEIQYRVRRGNGWYDPDTNASTKTIEYLMDKIGLTAAQQDELLEIGDRAIQQCIAKNASTPPTTIVRLAGSSDTDIRAAAASSINIPQDICEELAEDKELRVRSNLAGNHHASQFALRKLASDENEYVQRDAISNPNIDSQFLIEQASSADEWMRSSAARNISLPVATLVALSRDGSDLVREMAATNPNLPIEDLIRLCEDASFKVRQRAFSTKRLTDEELMQLPPETSSHVAALHVAHGNLPVDERRYYLRNLPPCEINKLVQQTKALDEDLLDAAEASDDTSTLICLAEREDTPTDTLVRLFEKGDGRVRRRLVHNPNMPYMVIKAEEDNATVYDDEIPF